mmetsp:Transcript_118602/g.236216  ORF Transcript_118602/g.236216 Transcript_118602/m.236216 type:complete len:203 (-) Transcript_118602:553-1161(-)
MSAASCALCSCASLNVALKDCSSDKCVALVFLSISKASRSRVASDSAAAAARATSSSLASASAVREPSASAVSKRSALADFKHSASSFWRKLFASISAAATAASAFTLASLSTLFSDSKNVVRTTCSSHRFRCSSSSLCKMSRSISTRLRATVEDTDDIVLIADSESIVLHPPSSEVLLDDELVLSGARVVAIDTSVFTLWG